MKRQQQHNDTVGSGSRDGDDEEETTDLLVSGDKQRSSRGSSRSAMEVQSPTTTTRRQPKSPSVFFLILFGVFLLFVLVTLDKEEAATFDIEAEEYEEENDIADFDATHVMTTQKNATTLPVNSSHDGEEGPN